MNSVGFKLCNLHFRVFEKQNKGPSASAARVLQPMLAERCSQRCLSAAANTATCAARALQPALLEHCNQHCKCAAATGATALGPALQKALAAALTAALLQHYLHN